MIQKIMQEKGGWQHPYPERNAELRAGAEGQQNISAGFFCWRIKLMRHEIAIKVIWCSDRKSKLNQVRSCDTSLFSQ